MGLFGKKKIKIIKEKNKGKDEFILDCVKSKEPMNLGIKVIQQFMKENSSWFILDTNFAYEREYEMIEEKLQNIINLLEEQGIQYIKKEKMVEKPITMMGFPVKKKKVKDTIVGIELTQIVLDNLEMFFNNMSIFCYMTKEKESFDEILNLHNRINVDGEEYRTLMSANGFNSFIYLDNFFRRIRISTEEDIDITIIEKMVEESYK